MANQLDIRKSLAIKQLHQQGISQRDIAQTLGVSRGAVIRHLSVDGSNSTKSQTVEVPTGSQHPNRTKAPTGAACNPGATDGVLVTLDTSVNARSRSSCVPFQQMILDKLAMGLDSQRIY